MPGNQNTQISDLSEGEMGCSGPSSRSPEGTVYSPKETPLPTGEELAPLASSHEMGDARELAAHAALTHWCVALSSFV